MLMDIILIMLQNGVMRLKPKDSFSLLAYLGMEIEKAGMRFMIPDNSTEMLEAFYGKGWRTPDRNWVARDSPRRFEDMPGFAENVDSVDSLNLI